MIESLKFLAAICLFTSIATLFWAFFLKKKRKRLLQVSGAFFIISLIAAAIGGSMTEDAKMKSEGRISLEAVGADSNQRTDKATTPAITESRPESDPEKPADPSLSARGACREFVKRALHDPSSAQWDPGKSWRWEDLDGGYWIVYPSFRGRNGHGAVVKSIFKCEIQSFDGKWLLLSLEEL